MNLSLIGILLALVLLTVLVYKKVNIVLAAVLCCVLMAITDSASILTSLNQGFLPGFAGFISKNFLIFAFSALFGKVMEDTGAAFSFAKLLVRAFGKERAIYGCMLATSLLTYGGVSVFVIAFTVFPIFLSVWQQSNLPRRLIPAAIAAAAVTYSEAFFPGAAQIHNIIPTKYLGTTPMAGALVGSIVGILMLVMLYFYFEYEIRKAHANGEGFECDQDTLAKMEKLEESAEVNPWLSIVPMAVLLITLNVFKQDVIVAMVLGSASAIIMFWSNIKDKLATINTGIGGATMAIVNTAAAVGFGAVVNSTAGFQTLVNWVMSLNGNPLITLGCASTIIAGITGSGAGGIGFTMEIFAERFLAMGVNPEIIHRVVTMAGVGLDSLPHNGFVVTLLAITGLTHKEAYKPMFITTVVFTTICLAIAMILGAVIYPIVPPIG